MQGLREAEANKAQKVDRRRAAEEDLGHASAALRQLDARIRDLKVHNSTTILRTAAV